MADNLNIIIKAILEASSKGNIIKEIESIQNHINKSPLKFKIDVDNEEFKRFSSSMEELTKKIGINFDRLSSKYISTTFEAGVQKSRTEVEKLTNAVGDAIKVTNKYREGKDTVTKIDVSSNYDKERLALEKLNAEQSKYWSQRVKETVSNMTQTPDELVKMRNYYTELESLSDKFTQKNLNDIDLQIQKRELEGQQFSKLLQARMQQEVQEKKITDEIHKQSLAQKDLLTQIKGIRGKDSAYISEENLTKLNRLENSVKNLDPAHKNFSRGLNSVKSQLKEVNADIGIYKKEVQDASKYTNVFGQSIFEAGKKFASWLMIGNVIMGVINSVKSGINTVIELDTAITDLKKVSDEIGTSTGVRSFLNDVNEMAIKVGHSTRSAIESITEFKRLGYSLEQSQILAEQSLIYSNISDQNIDDATKSIISTLKGFQLGVEDVIHVMDAYNEVGNNFAISSAGIGAALQRSSSALYEAGNTLEQSIGLITSANASIQNPEKVGNGLFGSLVA